MSEIIKKLEDDEVDRVAGGLKSNLEVAYDVMDGKYGNGEERVRRLRAAGYDPNAVQAIVNKLANGWRPADPYLGTGKRAEPQPYRDPYLG